METKYRAWKNGEWIYGDLTLTDCNGVWLGVYDYYHSGKEPKVNYTKVDRAFLKVSDETDPWGNEIYEGDYILIDDKSEWFDPDVVEIEILSPLSIGYKYDKYKNIIPQSNIKADSVRVVGNRIENNLKELKEKWLKQN